MERSALDEPWTVRAILPSASVWTYEVRSFAGPGRRAVCAPDPRRENYTALRTPSGRSRTSPRRCGLRLRLERAGCTREDFASDATVLLHEATVGVMRDLDPLATAALRETARKKRKLVECDEVDGDVVKLSAERKHLADVIKMVAYQAETDLVRRIALHYHRADDEARTLVQSMSPTPATSLSPRPNCASPSPPSARRTGPRHSPRHAPNSILSPRASRAPGCASATPSALRNRTVCVPGRSGGLDSSRSRNSHAVESRESLPPHGQDPRLNASMARASASSSAAGRTDAVSSAERWFAAEATAQATAPEGQGSPQVPPPPGCPVQKNCSA